MEELTLEHVAAYTRGTVYGRPDLPVSGVEIDSRKVKSGDLFVALKGSMSDGHSFVFKAFASGSAALVEREWAQVNAGSLPAGKGLVAVDNPQEGLQELSRNYRESLKVKVVGVTGSSGKTTTKDMIAAVLSQSFPVHKTQGNFNNELGLPLTLLGLDSSHKAAVVEMGMRGRGEISFLASLAQPEVAVITNIGTTHLELLGSQENIAMAKGELLEALPANGVAVLNGDDTWCRILGSKLTCQVIYYSIADPGADLSAKGIKPWAGKGLSFRVRYRGREAEVLLPLPGRHNAANALAAIGAGLSLGLELEVCARGLKELQMTAMRLEICRGPRETRIINDTYNANPASTVAALGVLAEQGANMPKVAVLGSMFELGADEEDGHRRVGEAAAGIKDLDFLVTVGELGRLIAAGAREAGLAAERIVSFAGTAEALDFLEDNLALGTWVLVKGSRGMKMEQVVEGLLEI